MSEPFVGEIKALGFSFAPRNYALCSGQSMSIAQNSALYSLLGTYYGGDGVQTFMLPDLRGRVAVNQGQRPGFAAYQLGQLAGVENYTLTQAQMPTHNHPATATATAATTVTPDSSGLSAATTINCLTAPSAKLATPVGNLLTVPNVVGAGTAVATYAAPGTGTPGTMATGASGAATTTLAGAVTATATTNVSVVPTIGNSGSNLPFSLMQPYLVITYAIAINGIYPARN